MPVNDLLGVEVAKVLEGVSRAEALPRHVSSRLCRPAPCTGGRAVGRNPLRSGILGAAQNGCTSRRAHSSSP